MTSSTPTLVGPERETFPPPLVMDPPLAASKVLWLEALNAPPDVLTAAPIETAPLQTMLAAPPLVVMVPVPLPEAGPTTNVRFAFGENCASNRSAPPFRKTLLVGDPVTADRPDRALRACPEGRERHVYPGSAGVATPLTRARSHRQPPESPSSPNGTLNLPGSVPPRQVLPLIVCPFAAAKCELHLDFAVLEVHRQRDKRQALLRFFADQSLDLPPVQQELPGSPRDMVGPCALRVLGYMNVMQPDFPVRD